MMVSNNLLPPGRESGVGSGTDADAEVDVENIPVAQETYAERLTREINKGLRGERLTYAVEIALGATAVVLAIKEGQTNGYAINEIVALGLGVAVFAHGSARAAALDLFRGHNR